MIFTACQSGGDVEEDNGGAPFVPEITISPKDLTFGCNGGEQEVAITANFEYEVAKRASWLTVEQTDEGLLVVVDANKNTSERSAFISITNSQYDINKTVEVWQEGYVPKIELAQQSIEVEFEPAKYEVAVTSPYSWEATTKNDWIEIETRTGIAGTKTLKFSVARNEEEDIREGTIVVKNDDYSLVAELYVTQEAFVPDELIIESESLIFAVEGGTQEIVITANFEYEFSTTANWLTIEKSEKSLNISATPNAKFEERTAEITISNKKYGISKTISVVQNGLSAEAQNVILYTSSDGKVVTPYKSDVFGANIVSNTYSNGQGIIIFDAPVISIGAMAFYNCTSLTSVTIGNGVTSIGNDAFRACTSLTSVTIPNSVTSIGNYALSGCSSLTSVTIPDSVTSIGEYTFWGCSSLTSVTIGNSVTSIGDWAFAGCSSLTSVTIPDSVTSIGDWAFHLCSSLTSVTIGNSVTSIGDAAFYNCTSLTSVYCKPTTPPTAIANIGYWDAFYDNASGRKIYVPRNSVNIYKSAPYWSNYASDIEGYDF